MRLRTLLASWVSLSCFALAAQARAQCTVTAPAHVVGRRATLEAPLVVSNHGDASAVGWVVPSHAAAGGGATSDDAAAVELGLRAEVTRTLDREEAPQGGGQFAHRVFRVTPAWRGSGFALLVDREDGEEPSTESVQCGAHRSVMYEAVRGRGDQMPLRTHLDATYTCRVAAPERPFAFGARAEIDARHRLSGGIALLAGADDAATLQALPWRLTLGGEGPRENAEAFDTLTRGNALEGVQAVRAGDAGWFVAFRFRRALYAGWVSPTFTALGGLATVGPAGAEQGLPAVAWNGTEALLVHASRANATQRWGLVAERVPVRGVPGASQTLATNAPATDHTFAPSVVATRAGWAVSYTTGPLTGAPRRRGSQDVWLRAFSASLAPVGDAVRLTDEAGGSDARIVANGQRVVGAYFGGQSDTRDVRALVARCE